MKTFYSKELVYENTSLAFDRLQAPMVLNVLIGIKDVKRFPLSPLAFSSYHFSCGNYLYRNRITLRCVSKNNVGFFLLRGSDLLDTI